MRIAIFDSEVIGTNPAGSCHQKLVQGLCDEYEFTVIATKFDNPAPKKIKWIRLPIPLRPMVLRFVLGHLGGVLLYLFNFLNRKNPFDLVQFVESDLLFGNVSYAHFCHRSYLNTYWHKVEIQGIRRHLRWLNHKLHAIAEEWSFRMVGTIVVPSQGLKEEIEREYPIALGKVVVIPNAVDLTAFSVCQDTEREHTRDLLKLNHEEICIVFVALGNFEHKGLPLLLESLKLVQDPRLKLVVVGGTRDLCNLYQQKAIKYGLGNAVSFVGMQRDVPRYLHAADLFVLPSIYETFSLVSFEAAAASLPLLVTNIHGVKDFMVNGKTGFVVERSAQSITEALSQFLQLSADERHAMGECARQAVQQYGVKNFVNRWRALYTEIDRAR